MSGWLWLLLYVIGYLSGVVYALRVARHAYADRHSMVWDYHGEKVDGGMAVLAGLGVLLLPLIWPIIGLGMLGWSLVVRGSTREESNTQP